MNKLVMQGCSRALAGSSSGFAMIYDTFIAPLCKQALLPRMRPINWTAATMSLHNKLCPLVFKVVRIKLATLVFDELSKLHPNIKLKTFN